MADFSWAGIDVSKKTFNVALDLDMEVRTREIRTCAKFDNSEQGVRSFYQWLDSLADVVEGRKVRILMEATGIYSKNLYDELKRQRGEIYIVVENPRKTKRFLDSEDLGNKTDDLDAKGLARYGSVKHPQQTISLPPEYEALRELVRAREDMVLRRDSLANLREGRSTDPEKTIDKIEQVVYDSLCKAVKSFDEEILMWIETHEELKRVHRIITSMPGMGLVSSSTFMSELGPVDSKHSREEFSRFTGLAPVLRTSGTSVRGSHLSRTGSTQLRKVFYMSSLHAIKKDPMLQAFHDRLISNGKSKLTAKCACMRKILLMLRSMIINNQTYDKDRYMNILLKRQKKNPRPAQQAETRQNINSERICN